MGTFELFFVSTCRLYHGLYLSLNDLCSAVNTFRDTSVAKTCFKNGQIHVFLGIKAATPLAAREMRSHMSGIYDCQFKYIVAMVTGDVLSPITDKG